MAANENQSDFGPGDEEALLRLHHPLSLGRVHPRVLLGGVSNPPHVRALACLGVQWNLTPRSVEGTKAATFPTRRRRWGLLEFEGRCLLWWRLPAEATHVPGEAEDSRRRAEKTNGGRTERRRAQGTPRTHVLGLRIEETRDPGRPDLRNSTSHMAVRLQFLTNKPPHTSTVVSPHSSVDSS